MQLAYDPDPRILGDEHSLIAGFQCQDDRFVVRSAHIWGNYWGIVGDSCLPRSEEGIRIALEELEPPIEGMSLRGNMFQVRKRRNIRIIYSGPQHGKEELGVETGRVRRIIIREWD